MDEDLYAALFEDKDESEFEPLNDDFVVQVLRICCILPSVNLLYIL